MPKKRGDLDEWKHFNATIERQIVPQSDDFSLTKAGVKYFMPSRKNVLPRF